MLCEQAVETAPRRKHGQVAAPGCAATSLPARHAASLEDVVLLEGRRALLDGEDAAVIKCKCLNDRDRLLRERARAEQGGEDTLLNPEGRPWIKIL